MPYEQIVFLGVAAQALAIASYIKQTLKGNTKPNKVTWLMWAVAPMIAAFAAGPNNNIYYNNLKAYDTGGCCCNTANPYRLRTPVFHGKVHSLFAQNMEQRN